MVRDWSSRGLGRAFVEVALEAGERVAATARNPDRLQDLVDTYGDAVLPLRLDVTDLAGRAVLDGDGSVLATNGVLHDAFLDLVAAPASTPSLELEVGTASRALRSSTSGRRSSGQR